MHLIYIHHIYHFSTQGGFKSEELYIFCMLIAYINITFMPNPLRATREPNGFSSYPLMPR